MEFGISQDCEMRLKRTTVDMVGNKHYRYQQYYRGWPVESSEYIVHAKDGIAININGEITQNFPVNIDPLINEQEALSLALNYLKAKKYFHYKIQLLKIFKRCSCKQ